MRYQYLPTHRIYGQAYIRKCTCPRQEVSGKQGFARHMAKSPCAFTTRISGHFLPRTSTYCIDQDISQGIDMVYRQRELQLITHLPAGNFLRQTGFQFLQKFTSYTVVQNHTVVGVRRALLYDSLYLSLVDR